ncbi:MAG: PTS galactitol transporter subunit IIC [Spirochaetales bacterium]|nr:PTS galactitol transporter subunit IIC [Spirochaetales bacterium]
METLIRIIDTFFGFKAYVMLPLIILILSMIIRMNITRALLSALKLAAGFAGIFIAFQFFIDNINPAVTALVETRGLDFPVLDVGWPPLAAITWASPIAHLSIPLIILINLVMLATNTTKTVYIDVWNYWHFALAGALILGTSNSMVLGLAATAFLAVYTIKLSDWTAPEVERETGLKGIAISPLSSTGLLPYAVGFNWLIDRIPGLKHLSYNPHKEGSGVKVLGEPMVIGVIVGILLGAAAGYGIKDLLELSVHIAAVMFILPKCGSLIGEGMEPVSGRLREVIETRFPKKTGLNVALDANVILEHRSILSAGLILMPISLAIALVLPGNKTLPLGDLPALISQISVITLVSRGNVIRAVLAGIPLVSGYLLIATRLAPLITRLSMTVGAHIPDGAQITAFTDGGNPVRFWAYHLFTGNIIALAVLPLVGLLFYLSYRNYRRAVSEDNPI